MRKLICSIAAVAVVGLFAGSAWADPPPPGFKGNGLPLIPMNNAERIILSAHQICPSTAKDNGGGRVIFLQANFGAFDGPADRHPDLLQINDIEISQSPDASSDFKIVDGNACDIDPAQVLLPGDVSTTFLAFLRVVGPIGSGVDIATCGFDTVAADIICGVAVVKVRLGGKGDTKFMDFTRRLLSVAEKDLFQDPDIVADTTFWEVFTQGRAKAHMVFVPCGDTTLDGILLECETF